MKITLKSVLMGAAATSIMIGGMAYQAPSAEAIDLKNGDIIGNIIDSQNTLGEFTLDFAAPATQTVDGLSSTIPPFVAGDQVFLSTLSNITPGVDIGAVIPFISDIDLDDGVSTDKAQFNITSAIFSESAINPGNFELSLDGDFISSTNTTLGIGNLTLQFAQAGAYGVNPTKTTNSTSLTVVPTPAAVLPGLVGMATAAFRKKKQEEDNELATVGAETQA